jgi:hypothetical protein
MPTMRRAALLGLVTLLVAATARAQTEPPPATPPLPPPTTPAEPPPAAAPPAPVAPLPSTMAPEPTPGPPLQLTERSPTELQAPRPEPFYRTSWFWAVVGVAFATAFIITFVELRDKSSGPPATTFGNMNAF